MKSYSTKLLFALLTIMTVSRQLTMAAGAQKSDDEEPMSNPSINLENQSNFPPLPESVIPVYRVRKFASALHQPPKPASPVPKLQPAFQKMHLNQWQNRPTFAEIVQKESEVPQENGMNSDSEKVSEDGDSMADSLNTDDWQDPLSARRQTPQEALSAHPLPPVSPNLDIVPHRGLKNLGLTCFMNVVLQTLYHLAPFRETVMELEGEYVDQSGMGWFSSKLASSFESLNPFATSSYPPTTAVQNEMPHASNPFAQWHPYSSATSQNPFFESKHVLGERKPLDLDSAPSTPSSIGSGPSESASLHLPDSEDFEEHRHLLKRSYNSENSESPASPSEFNDESLAPSLMSDASSDDGEEPTHLNVNEHQPQQEKQSGHKNGQVSLALKKVFQQMKDGDSQVVDTSMLAKALGWDQNRVLNSQQDADEFLTRELFDKMETDLKINGGNIIKKMFTGVFNNYIECINVPYTSSRTEEFTSKLILYF